MDVEKLRQAYGEMMAELSEDKPIFTSVQTGERGTSEYFEAMWRAAHPPILANNIVMFPVAETEQRYAEDLPNLAVAGS